MALRIFRGAADAGASRAMLREIISASMAHPDRNYLVIVPEQFSMETQKALTSMHPRGGLLNIDVLSLAHLSYRVFAETGTKTAEMLEDNGKTLVLHHLFTSLRQDLPYLRPRLSRTGGIEDIKSLLSELMQYGISPDAVFGAALDAHGSLKEKLGDIGRVYEAYLSYLENTYLTSEELPVHLSRVIERSARIRNTTLAFDGFTGFTPVQLPVLRSLLIHARDVWVSVTADRDEYSDDLFLLGQQTVSALTQICAQEHVPVLPACVCRDVHEGKDPALVHLTRSIFRVPPAVYPRPSDALRLASYPDPRAELSFIAGEIRALVRSGMRYRDIAVITGDPEGYAPYVRQIFSSEDLPFYLDEKTSASHLTLTEFLRAAMQVFAEDWSAPSIFRLLRCGFLPVSADETDVLENYVLALGIRGQSRWREPFSFHTKRMDPAKLLQLNEIREKVVSCLAPVHAAFAKAGSTAAEKTGALYELCLSLSVQEQLAVHEDALRKNGETAKADAYAQIYPVIMDLFDKIVTVLGAYPMTVKDYRALLENALGEITIGTLPPGSDLVKVGDMMRTRLTGIRVLFFAGVNEGLIPKSTHRGGLLSEADRAVLERLGISLSPAPREEVAAQRFYLYLALARPADKLYLTCARAGADGSARRPAFLMREVARLFPNVPYREENTPSIRDAQTPEAALRLLPEALHLREKDVLSSWYGAYLYLLRHAPYDRTAERLVQAALPAPPQDTIGKAAAQALFGTRLTGSATRLEQFAACAFRHFASYGLQLTEREVFSYSGADRGTLLHEALSLYAVKARESGRRWQDIPETEQEMLCAACLDAVSADYRHLLLKDPGTAYEQTRLLRLLTRTVKNLTSELSRGDFVPYSFEEAFGEKGQALVRLPLKDGSLSLTGRIDRIDVFEDPDCTYVKVIDYKSGNTAFDLSSVCSGLQLQLSVYMHAALAQFRSEGKNAAAAALFYHPVSDPVIDYEPLDDDEARGEKLLAAAKPSGIVSAEPDVLAHLDHAAAQGMKSTILPVSYTKNGGFTKSSHVASAEQFTALEHFALAKARGLGNEILSGKCAALPTADGTKLPCTYCPFISLCGFDPASQEAASKVTGDADELFALMEEMTATAGGDTE